MSGLRFLAAVPWIFAGDLCHAIGCAICGHHFTNETITEPAARQALRTETP